MFVKVRVEFKPGSKISLSKRTRSVTTDWSEKMTEYCEHVKAIF